MKAISTRFIAQATTKLNVVYKFHRNEFERRKSPSFFYKNFVIRQLELIFITLKEPQTRPRRSG